MTARAPRRRRSASRRTLGGRLAALALTALMITSAAGCQEQAATPDPGVTQDGHATTLHYAANDNITASGQYAPNRLGFTLADVSTRHELRALPRGVKALVFLGTCRGVDRHFVSRASPFIRDPRVFGFYLIDEPQLSTCPPARLKQESDWVHAHAPGTRTFVIIQNLASSRRPSYRGSYTHENSGIDLFGINPYPCRSELGGCDLAMVRAYVRAAEAAGIPRSRMVPVFQAFGGGAWRDDRGGRFLLPTPAQATELLSVWEALLPDPPFDFVYSWGRQRGDESLATASAALQQVFASHNRGSESDP